jgi:serine phosphatase RsbU (regulator of sigma subunit)
LVCHLKHILAFLCAVSLLFSSLSAQAQTVEAKDGILDLRNFPIEKQIAVLDGDWSFYWERLMNVHDFDTVGQQTFQKVPSMWRGSLWQGKALGRDGYASYRLKVLLPKGNHKRLGLRVGRVNSSYVLLVNDTVVGGNGQLGESIETEIPQHLLKVYEFEVSKDTLDIVFHVANFHYHTGGLRDSVELSSPANLRESRELALFLDFVLIGSILMIGLYHLSIYFQRKEDKSNLYFFILCFAVALRIISSGERVLTYFIPDFNWEMLIKMEFVSAMVGLIYLSYFFRWLFPKDYWTWLIKLIVGVEFAFLLIFILLPARFSSYAIPYHNYTAFAILLANLVVVVLAAVRKREGSLILVWGFALGAFFVANDILHNLNVVHTGSTAPIGLLAFFFSQALLLSNLSSKAFKKVLDLSDKLEETNRSLEEKVRERTLQLQESNEELNQIVEELNISLELAENQKHEIEVQNKNITASINYAKRIQEAMLPIKEELMVAFPESFIFYKPKDIVSGDFYWFAEKEGKQILVVADCTGHGIPGAFMSVVGLCIVNQLVNLHEIISPEKILHDLNEGIRKILRQETNKQHEGMDISVCVIDKARFILEYAGAHRPLYYIQHSQLNEIKGNRISVGGGNDERTFNKHTIDISSPTVFYLFSDGFQDQYGGESKKKVGAKLFKEMLFEVHSQDVTTQGAALEEKFELWQGEEKQIDDVLVVGVRLS